MALIPVDEARAQILSAVNALPAEVVAIDDALGRALAQPLSAVRTLPPWDNSAMDGYAVLVSDVAKPPATLKVIERIFAGDVPRATLVKGTCARIMTGAQLPPGADAVVMQEHATALEGEQVRIDGTVSPGANVRRRGEDVQQGAPLFAAGRSLSVADAGLLWSQGLERVAVHRRPRVAVVSSGDELCDVGALVEGKIVDSNAPSIAAAVRRAGGIPLRIGRAEDTLASARAHFERGLEADVLVTIAGASVGEKDFTREALLGLGVGIDFWKVAMKPGKPLAFGRRGQTLVFGLPGNPVSALVTFELFVRPALRALQGLAPLPATLPARAAVAISKAPGLRHFVRATWVGRDGAVWATPLASQSSGALSSAAGASCLIDVPAESTGLEIGSACEVLPVSWGE